MADDTGLPLDRWEREIARLSPIEFNRGEHAFEIARAQALIEEILEAYASGGEEVRQHLWALCDRYPRFFRRASCVLWQTLDPLTTARLYLLFLSLCYYNDPDWAATVDHVVKEALRRAPPVDRDALAALLRWVASFHAPKSDPEIWLSPREYFEQLAADVLGEAGGEGSGGAIL